MKVSIVHTKNPSYGWLGGSELILVSAIEALKDVAELEVYSFEKPPINKINSFFGTSIRKKSFKWSKVNFPWHLKSLKEVMGLLRRSLIIKVTRKQTKDSETDVWLCTNGPVGLKRDSLEYIHSPHFLNTICEESKNSVNIARSLYERGCEKVVGDLLDYLSKSKNLVNSKWTKQQLENGCNLKTTVLYPPVRSNPHNISWDDKENGFVCVGRVSPTKNTFGIAKILQKVIEKYNTDSHLHIVGKSSDNDYFEKLQKFASTKDWLSIEGVLSRKQLLRLLAEHKYGIHGMPKEHFGIAVGEMVSAGCVVFVPDSGGQVEIVNDNRLTYANDDEAVRNISKILADRSLQLSLSENLQSSLDRMRPQAFKKELKKSVIKCYEKA